MNNWGSKRIPAIGSKTAKIVFIGECPCTAEVTAGLPFAGGAGKVLDGLLNDSGLCKEEVYLTTVVKYRPKGNNFNNFYEQVEVDALTPTGKPTKKKKRQATQMLQDSIIELQEEIAEIKPNIIVAMGNEALLAVAGISSITKHRGSILQTAHGKCIPTYAPMSVLRNWKARPIALFDFGKIKRESLTPTINRVTRDLKTMPSHGEILDVLDAMITLGKPVSFDIETETNQITCVGFSNDPTSAICVPFWYGSSGSHWSIEQEVELWLKITELLEGPTPVIAQNAQFDILFMYDQMGIVVKNLYMDTMIAGHLAYPELPKGLDFLVSIYTDQPYYKDMIHTGTMREYYEYNCLDACCTLEVAQEIEKELKELGLWEFYTNYLHKLITPLLSMSKVGVKIDKTLKNRACREYRHRIGCIEEEIDKLVGHELNVNSPKQMVEYLYTELGLPKQYRRRKNGSTYTKTITADEEAIKELHRKHPNKVFEKILELRGYKKVLSTYLEAKTDQDGRMRTSYIISGTDTGRLASRESIRGTGTNFQNIPKGVAREMFIPDGDNVFVSADLSQAEARVVAYLAGEESLIRLFQEGAQVHRRIGSSIFGVQQGDLTSEQYRLAKAIVHGTHYGMGPATLAKTTGIPFAEAKKLQNAYFAAYPGIKVWQLRVQSQLNRNRYLETPLGRKRQFMGTYNQNLVKEAYAYVPQSTVSDMLNMGLIKVYNSLPPYATLLLQVHDSVIVQCPREKIDNVCGIIKYSIEQPILIEGIDQRIRECMVPVEFEVGTNWDNLKDYEYGQKVS